MADTPKKILMLNSVRGLVGGVERLLIKMSELLASSGWQVYGLFEASFGNDPAFDAAFYDIKMLSEDSLESLLCYYQAEGIQLICVHKISNSGALLVFKQLFPAAVIVHDHDYYCLRRHKYFPYRRKNCHLPFSSVYCPVCSGMIQKSGSGVQKIDLPERRRLLEAVREAQISFVLSKAMRKNLLMNGWDPANIRLLVPFQDLPKALPKATSEIPQILYVGQLIRGKGADLLLKAVALTKRDFRLIIQGQGKDLDFLKALAVQLGLGKKVIFNAFSTDLDKVYSAADLLVVPSRWQEPFGLVGLEAFAHKVPVVAFDVGGISEWLKHKVNGLLVLERDYKRLARAIEKLLDDADLRKSYGERGWQMTRDLYNRAAFEASFLPVLDAMISSAAGANPATPPKTAVPLWQSFVAALFTLFLSLPAGLYFLLFKGTKGFEKQYVWHPGFEKLALPLINSKNWLLRHALLFPWVLTGRLRLVGVSFWDYSAPKQPQDYKNEVPGIFSLHFIRKSSKMPMNDQEANDREYLQRKGLLYDFLLIWQALAASAYHHPIEAITQKLDIFGIKLSNISMQEALDLIDSKLNSGEKSEVFFVNADCLNKTFQDKEYYNILADTKILLPDGSGINLAAKLLGSALQENLNGTDLLPYLCSLAVRKGYSLYLLGAKEGVAEAMQENLESLYPGLKIAGTHHGYFDFDAEYESVIAHINESGADILLVAFGAPLQEKFIRNYRNILEPRLLMGVGGLFDFYSNQMPRAPLWMRQIGIEWVYRLFQEPKRMWKRYIIGNPLFLYRVWRWKKAKGKNK